MKRREGDERASVDPSPGALAETIAPRSVLPPDACSSAGDTPWVLAGRYEILGLIGAGGMGTVYRARDRELDETVALKMLRRQFASAAKALERFKREVKLARRVTHPNVARTFDIGEHEGAKFLTMELVDGEMLRAVLARRTKLDLAEAVGIGVQICAGLAAAHAAGVLHRDLKPENIIVARDGRIVITDFGIARALTAEDGARSGDEVVGTPAYMAPEQLEGSPLDVRADVYALGTVLYELLTGDVPWSGASPIQAAIARLNDPPPDVRAMRPSLPESAAAFVAKCLATKREDRFPSAVEAAEALAALAAAPPPAPSHRPPNPAPRLATRATVAVLPLANEGDREHDYLAGSIGDDIVDVLEKIDEVRVVHGQKPAADARGAGRALGVHAVVSGTFLLAGDLATVSASLVTVEDGIQLWSRRFARDVASLASIGEDAAAEIAHALTTSGITLRRAPPTDPVAYDLYLRGRYVLLRGWYDAGGDAVRLLGEAQARAPRNATIAAAYARALARAYGVDSIGDGRAAQEAAEKAIALDPTSADARAALALVHLYRGEGGAAAIELSRAVRSAPADPDVLELLGRVRAEVGPVELAIEHLGAALEREPSSAEARYTLARAHALRRAWSLVDKVMGPDPDDADRRVPHVLTRARLLLWRGDRDLVSAMARATRLDPGARAQVTLDLILRVGASGALSSEDREAVSELFRIDAATGSRRAAFNAQIRAELCVAGGDAEAALEAVRDADASGLVDVSWLEQCPLLDGLRSSPALDGVRRTTALRAARVRDLLPGA